MASSQNEFPVPTGKGNNKVRTSSLLPRFYRTDSNKKFVNSTLDQLVQPGTVKKVNGYIGRQNAKSSTGANIFVEAVDKQRQDYQLEPSLVVKDTLGNVDYFKDYIDYINQLEVFGAKVDNHERLNRQEFYSWNPHINWDKFVNFQQYYWLPYGPDVIDVYGQQREIESTYTVTWESEQNSKEFLFTPNGLTRNPILKLYRGQTYYFNVDSEGEPFSIKTTKTSGPLDRYDWGIDTTSAVEQGQIKFTIPDNAPNVLFYVSENDANLGGVFKIYDIKENTEINVGTEIIGKKTYKLPNGTELSNGMKLQFRGNVIPEEYGNDLYYVEGVGDKIALVAERDLEIISNYSDSIVVPFDDTTFDYYPFDIASSYSNKKDYIVINRASKDRNPWTRYNRWFHKDVIETSAAYNGKIASLDQTSRAVRPIIEFEAGLKLFNFGIEAILDVDLIDTFTTDAFSTIEGQLGYSVDGIQLVNGHRVMFTADTDSLVKNKIYRVEFINVVPPGEARRRQIRLVEESTPVLYQTALVKYGVKNQGLMYWYNGSTWVKAQQKTAINQTPLFDVVDETRNSYSDASIYDGSTFAGTKLFSYAVGTGTADSELGFALKYKNINNVGDIVFDFNLLSDTFIYKTLLSVETVNINVGSLVKSDGLSSIKYVNGWETSNVTRYQPVLRVYRNSNKVNNFDLDVYDDITDLTDLELRVYVNGKRLDKSLWTVVDTPVYKRVVLDTDVTTNDVVTLKSFAKQPKNNNGHYDLPINLQNNPLNNDIGQFTLGEVIDHVDSIIDNLTTFSGVYPGPGNLRDLGNVSPFGVKFVQHSGAMPLSMYHITSKNSNIIKALQESRDDYGKFKREFILVAENLGVDIDTVKFVDLILEEINKNKPKTFPYYFSDMVPYGASKITNITVVDYRTQTYPLSSNFNLDVLSVASVLVYVNGVQLVYGVDYSFDGLGFVIINSANLANDDTITIVEYENTDASFVPPTPTKLGLWPKYEPKKYLDTTFVTPQYVIQGHDGSITMAYGDYRDDLILELEKRIFNNIKVTYDTTIFDVNDYIPRYNTESAYSLTEFNEILAPNFYQWVRFIDKDFTKPIGFDSTNPFTFNYLGHTTPDGRPTPGYWRGIYRWMFDTDRPNICPWEMLGYSVQPSWWVEVYGPAPYTFDNLVMWQDLAEGVIREPGKPVLRNAKYVRPYLLECIPVNSDGYLKNPIESNTAQGVITNSIGLDFIFGDVTPVESTWRRSSYYPFSVIATLVLCHPADLIGKLFDRSRVIRDLSNQIVYTEKNVRLRLEDIVTPNIYSDTTRVQTSGLVNYLVDYIQGDSLKSLTQYRYDLDNLTVQLAYRIAGFTEKEKFNLLLDSKNPTAVGGVFVPQENYSIELNTSSPVKRLVYSGVLLTKTLDGFEVKGYSVSSPYFYYYPWTQVGYVINVGGISESFSDWDSGKQYVAGKIVRAGNAYYRVMVSHVSSTDFNSEYFQRLSALPIIGGQDAYIRTSWDRSEKISVPYGTVFRTVQEVVDFLLGYGEYLKDQGFVFDDFNVNIGDVSNWVTSSKEFLFWTTQNWSAGQVKWYAWEENKNYTANTLVKYDGEIYRVISNINSGSTFDLSKYEKQDNVSSVGASVIGLSPAASGLTLNIPYCVVEDVRDQFNGYEFFRPDGQKLEPEFLNSYREDNKVQYSPSGPYGIYGATFYLVQKEHVLLIDNSTLFNDTIYEQTTGYRQEKVKISAYISTGWYGGFDIPGFIYDQALVKNWEPWTDYNLGEVVKYKEFYYSANSFLPGSEEFIATSWTKLREKPTDKMIPNWSYKAEQFTDFYSLDSDNFDVGQQKMAQHLIGYQKRQYLENIIKDDISEYKFYQGMIIEKGTQNVLNKLFDVLSADNQESVKFFEEWAVRVGEYGSSGAFEEIEFKLDESLFKLNPQPIELVNQVDPTLVDFVIRQTPNDVYLKPKGYSNAPWPLLATDELPPYLRTPGYVRLEDVTANVDTIDEILTKNIADFKEQSYVWCAFEGRDWNIYRVDNPEISVDTVAYDSELKTFTITTTADHNIGNDDIVGVTSTLVWDNETTYGVGDLVVYNSICYIATAINTGYEPDQHTSEWAVYPAFGFYKVTAPTSTTIVISGTQKDYPSPEITNVETIQLFTISSQRVPAIDLANDYIPTRLNANELLWVDDSGDGTWATYKHRNVYVPSTLNNSDPGNGQENGRTVAVDSKVTVAAIANDKNELKLYNKAGTKTVWVQGQTITLNGNEATVALGAFARVVEFSADKTWLLAGSPTASNVFTRYQGVYNSLSTYTAGDVVKGSNNLYYKATGTVSGTDPITGVGNWQQTSAPSVDINGSSTATSAQGLASLWERDANGEYVLIKHFHNYEIEDDNQFGNSVKFVSPTTFLVGAVTPDTSGKVYRYDYVTLNGTKQWVLNDQTFPLGTEDVPIINGCYYGLNIASNDDGSRIAISAYGASSVTGKVFIYELVNGDYEYVASITGTQVGQGLGSSLAMSSLGTYLAVGSTFWDIPNIDGSADEGKVVVYIFVDGEYTIYQEITSRKPENNEWFGSTVSFMNDYETLVIYSLNGDSVEPDLSTTYVDSGRIDIYDVYDTKWIYSESLDITPEAAVGGFGQGFAVGQNHILVAAPAEVDRTYESGVVYDYQKNAGEKSWEKYRQELPKVNLQKIKKVFLYNKKSNETIGFLDIVDAAQGNIIGLADQEIKFKTFYDPATYSYKATSSTYEVNVDDGMAWTNKNVGMLWWDLTRAKFLDSYNGDIVYRSTNWNTLYPTASIDVYEWVETTLKPSEWDKQADTVTGLTTGISGTSLYGDEVYSVKQRYDNVAKTFKPIYYFWVKNKTTIPNAKDRFISSNDVARAIADPKGQGYKYIAFTGENSFSLVNVKPNLIHKDVHLNVEYWTINEYDINFHTEWKLISNDENASLPQAIESKLIDSLCGKDLSDRVVPDLSLPPKLRYGVEERPRQSMFVNRYEALKEYIERVNSVLKKYTIVEDRDISDLGTYEKEPSTITGLYDTVIDTDAELRFIGTSTFKKAVLTAVIVDGKITDVEIVDGGLGYVNAPYIDVLGPAGKNAKLKAILNARGQVVDVNIENTGRGYDSRINAATGIPYTTLEIRSLSALVRADSGANGGWSIYSYDVDTQIWSRIRSQAYDVRKYWKYVDWYATGYSQFDPVDFSIDATYLISTITVQVGQLIKVNNVGTGGWLLLEKYADVDSIDYTQSYKIVGRQNGTIQFIDKLYRFANTNLGYDGPLYDGDNFDNTAVKELRVILTAIKDKILIDNLKQDYLDAFFAVVRYALSEQTWIDWIFKTSFVRAQHNVGDLKQKVTYNNDNLADFEDYVNEVKPYRTKIREFVSSYNAIDNSQSVVTDFDLQPTYINNNLEIIYTKVEDGAITSAVSDILEYPWRHWFDNAGYQVTKLELIDGGSGYLSPPTVNIESNSGSGAVAKAYISNGRVNRIELLNQGSGYLSAPTITLEGGLNVGGQAGRVVAIIGDGVVRSNYVKVKFDRVTGNYHITNLQETETFTASGSQIAFNLKWSPSLNRSEASVTVNGIDALDGTFTLSTKKSVTRGYTSYYGLLTFTSPPPSGAVVKITYIKDFNYLSAADRINWYYNPATKELGRDTRQLMTGVDYGGVQIIGLGFEVPKGWGSLPWFTDGWDSQDPTFDDYIIQMTPSTLTHQFTLPYTPDAGEQINIYYKSVDSDNHVRLDALDYAGVAIVDKPDVIMQTFVGDGETNLINIPLSLDIVLGDEFIFRKSTSDGSVKPNENDYDTSLLGGDLAYNTATGLAADDILVDGDGLVTPTTSPAPEEVVPGQVVDTLAINVTTRPADGSALIKYNNFVFDGATITYPLELVPNSNQAVAVLYSHIARPLIVDIDYTIDYVNQEVTLLSPPPVNTAISIITFGYSGSGLVEIDYFVADGVDHEYITGASWSDDGANAIVYVNGLVVPYEIFRTDSSYETANLVGIRFSETLPANSIINYAVVNTINPTFSVMKTETFITDGSATYELQNQIGDSTPLESNVLVYTTQNNSLYVGPSGTYFTIENGQLEYSIPVTRFSPYSIDAVNLTVQANGDILDSGKDYTLDLSGITVKLKQKIYNKYVGKELALTVNTSNSYVLTNNSITFTTPPAPGLRMAIISFYKHDYLGIQRTNVNLTADVVLTPESVEYYEYSSVFGKHIKLDRPVLDDSRVWVIKNGKLLQHSIDYKLNPDLESINLADYLATTDKVTVVTFSSNVVRSSFKFMIFKDMLNRTHYKRVSRNRQTELLEDLHYNDTQIVVRDDRVLNEPNKQLNQPGILYIAGERVEYFTKVGNVLSQLRRGTLGTGVRQVYAAGTKVQDIGASETIPYKDTTITEQHVSDGVSLEYALDTILPMKDVIDSGHSYTTALSWEDGYDVDFNSTIPTNLIQGDDIDVFVGGYNILGDWAPNVGYLVDDIVMVGTYTFRCVIAHTSSTAFTADETNWQFFVGNIRLKKHPQKVHNVNIHYESPEGDIQLEPDFAVTGNTNAIRLTHRLGQGTKFTVVKKTGKVFEDQNSSLADSNNAIAKFITAELDLINEITDVDGQPLTDNDGNILEI